MTLVAKLRQRWSAPSRELRRLIASPRHVPGSTTLLGSPFRYVDAPSFGWQYKAIFEQGIYRLPSSISAPRIVDCGANVGTAVVYWKREHPGARITAFEPDPAVFSVLRSNLTEAKIDDVELVRAAVWDSAGTTTFEADYADAGRVSSDGDLIVSTIRLRDRLVQDRIDLLKMDIEGAESTVLNDCADALDGVTRIFVEYHSIVGQPQRFDEVIDVLADAGFRLHFGNSMTSVSPFIERRVEAGMDTQLDIFGFRDM
jgi:FkbM family methyltransferase